MRLYELKKKWRGHLNSCNALLRYCVHYDKHLIHYDKSWSKLDRYWQLYLRYQTSHKVTITLLGRALLLLFFFLAKDLPIRLLPPFQRHTGQSALRERLVQLKSKQGSSDLMHFKTFYSPNKFAWIWNLKLIFPGSSTHTFIRQISSDCRVEMMKLSPRKTPKWSLIWPVKLCFSCMWSFRHLPQNVELLQANGRVSLLQNQLHHIHARAGFI